MGRMMELMRELWRVVVGKLDWMLLDASGHIQIFGKRGIMLDCGIDFICLCCCLARFVVRQQRDINTSTRTRTYDFFPLVRVGIITYADSSSIH